MSTELQHRDGLRHCRYFRSAGGGRLKRSRKLGAYWTLQSYFDKTYLFIYVFTNRYALRVLALITVHPSYLRCHYRSVDTLLSTSISTCSDHSSMAAPVVANGNAHTADWQDRYHDIDQVLNRPGPRTDPSFAAGDEVRLVNRLVY